MQERWRSWYAVWAWTSCIVQASFHVPSVALEWTATASSATGASTGCTRNAVGSNAWQRTLTTNVHSARELHVPCPLDGRPQREVCQTWQAGGGSFLLLPRRHALSSRWLCTFNHNTCENCLEEVKGAATSSLFMPPLFQDTWPCVRSAMLHASETWPLTKPNLQCLQQNDRAMIRQICNVRPQDVVTTRPNELLAWLGIEDLDLILRERRLRWYRHVECFNGAVKTAFHIQVEGKRGPGTPKMTWKQLRVEAWANSADPDEMAHNEPSHQDLHYLPLCFSIYTKPTIFNNGLVQIQRWKRALQEVRVEELNQQKKRDAQKV